MKKLATKALQQLDKAEINKDAERANHRAQSTARKKLFTQSPFKKLS